MVTLAAMREATNTKAVSRFLEEAVLPGTGWELEGARRNYVRLEPPADYWASYKVRLRPAAETESGTAASFRDARELRLVARGMFEPSEWAAYRATLQDQYSGLACDPLNTLGCPVIFDATQHAVWFYPVDPGLPGLSSAADPARIQHVLGELSQSLPGHPDRISSVEVELARYAPEISAILRYRIAGSQPDTPIVLYGKVQRGRKSQWTAHVMGRLWRLSQVSGGALSVPRPVAHLPELGLVLQEEVLGTPVGSDRTRPEFADHVRPAAGALAVIHESGIEVADSMQLTDELDRLDDVVSQLALVHPPGHFLLRELLLHVRARLRHTGEEEFLPTHGDCKYDQFLHHDGAFSLIDFDYFGMAETSYDLGKYCAYLVPSQPQSWEHSAIAEECRRAFLSCYRDLRPHATIQRFPMYEAVNLANRAMTLMWAQSPGWEQAADGLLALGMERLNSRLPV